MIYILPIPKMGSSFIRLNLAHVFGKKVNLIDEVLNGHKGVSRSTQFKDDDLVISIVRNPFDLLVSYYESGFQQSGTRGVLATFANISKNHIKINYDGFDDFVSTFLTSDLDDSWQLLQRNFLFFQHFNNQGISVPNKIIRLENMTSEFIKLADEYDFELKGIEPLRVTWQRDGRPYQEYYNEGLKKLVEDRLATSLEYSGYNFEGVFREDVNNKNYMYNFETNEFRKIDDDTAVQHTEVQD